MARAGGQKLGIETGRAVDPAGTHAHHQIFRVERNGKYDTVHYSIFYAYAHALPNLNVPREFVENARDIKIKNNQDKIDVEKSFLALSDHLRPAGRNAAFETGQLCHALTYDLHFSHDHRLTGFFMRPTLAVMTDHLSYKQANESYDDAELTVWQCAVGAKPHCFEDVTTRTTAIIQESLRTAAFQNGMDCVYHIPPKDAYATLSDIRGDDAPVHRIGRYLPQYGSVLSGAPRKSTGPGRALVSGTAVRNIADMFNVTVVSEFLKHNGRNIFAPAIAKSFVKYRHALMTWNALNPSG